MAYFDSELQRVRSPILGYGLADVSVVIATAVALAIQEYQFRDVELPLLVLVVGLVTWYAGTGPAVIAVLLSTAVFSYLFVEPIYSFYVSARDIPYFLIFVLSAVIVASFGWNCPAVGRSEPAPRYRHPAIGLRRFRRSRRLQVDGARQ